MKVHGFVDGMNLHRGILAQPSLAPYFWIDVLKLCRQLVQGHWRGAHLERVTYCSAPLSWNHTDQSQPERQRAYHRALATRPEIALVMGYYSRSSPPVEKQTDVNLASLMIYEAMRLGLDGVVLVTNDSDLVMPIRLLSEEMEVPVLVVNPAGRFRRAGGFKTPRTWVRDLREGDLIASQFPDELSDSVGTIHKPSRPW